MSIKFHKAFKAITKPNCKTKMQNKTLNNPFKILIINYINSKTLIVNSIISISKLSPILTIEFLSF